MGIVSKISLEPFHTSLVQDPIVGYAKEQMFKICVVCIGNGGFWKKKEPLEL